LRPVTTPVRPSARHLIALAPFILLFLAVAFGCKLKRDKRGFGEECVNAEDCTSEMCTTFGSICTKACTYDRECGKNLVCRSDGSAAGNSCAKPLGAPINGACR